jgi:hypothetical protein
MAFMNHLELQRKLIAAARAHAPGDHVPYAFEKRVMALLASRGALDYFAFWARGLWRAAASCVAIALLLGAWVFFSPAASATSADLSQSFESTLLASINPGDETQ